MTDTENDEWLVPAKEKIPRKPLRFPTTAEPMPSEQFRRSLETLGIGQSAFARWIGVGDRSVRTWISGSFPVPLAVGYLVTLLIRTKTRPEDLTP
jgi:DNA-binding transcriptional regulator YiaG